VTTTEPGLQPADVETAEATIDLRTSIVTELKRRHPAAQHDRLLRIATDAIEDFSDARVLNFVPVLARRRALDLAKAQDATDFDDERDLATSS